MTGVDFRPPPLYVPMKSVTHAIREPSVLSATPQFPVAVCVVTVSCFLLSFFCFLRLFDMIGWCRLFPPGAN